MQKYKEINGNDYVKDSRTTINETMQSIQSMNSGTAFPTNNLFEGMKCYRTDLKKTYTLTDAENGTWVEDAHASLSDEATHAAAADTATKVNATVPPDKVGELVKAKMGDNDAFRIAVGGSAKNGWVELATADDGTESIYVRQYADAKTDGFVTPTRTATLLDGSGNTSFPGKVTAPNFIGSLNGNAATATKLQTPRTLSLTGKATGSATFDGSANAAINVTSVNADTASKLSTARKINITGNATGAATFDGTSDANINVSVSQAAHADKATQDTNGRAFTDTNAYMHISALADNTDFNNVKTTGIYYCTGGTYPNRPCDSWGILTVYSIGTVKQEYRPDNAAVYYTREYNSVNWTAWSKVNAANADTATKLQTARTISLTGDITGSASFDGSSNISINASRPYVVEETKVYNVNLSTLDTTKFYPIIFEPDRIILRCEIHSPSSDGYALYNQNVISFRLLSQGWSDTPSSFSIDEYGVYDTNEITIGCIGKGFRDGRVCVWVRGGLTYMILSNRKPTLYTEDTTLGLETFTVGTNYYGGTGNNNVWPIFMPQQTITSGSWHDGTAYGLFEKATKLATARTISLTGNASGSADFDGSGNISINTTVSMATAANSATKLANNGNRNDLANGTKAMSGLSVYQCYLNTGYPQQYGNVVSIGGTGDNELFLGWGDDSRLLYRAKRDNESNWKSWRAIAFTDEINNYAPTKTGVGASGTWGISITGNANTASTASSVAWSGVTGKPGTYPPSAHNHDSAYPSVTGARASGTWGINISGNADSATNADTVDGYHASDIINRISAANTGGIVAASITENGYAKFANGLILQWGNAKGKEDEEDNYTTFPIAFPSTCFVVLLTSKSYMVTNRLLSQSKTGFTWTASSGLISWAALGM